MSWYRAYDMRIGLALSCGSVCMTMLVAATILLKYDNSGSSWDAAFLFVTGITYGAMVLLLLIQASRILNRNIKRMIEEGLNQGFKTGYETGWNKCRESLHSEGEEWKLR